MDERKRFRLLWKALDRQRRGEVRRYALLGRQATDPETAWLTAMFAGKGVGLWADVVYLGVGLLAWIVPGTVALVLVVGRRGFPVWVLLWPLGQIVTGIVMLWLLLNLRRARRLNISVAVPPGE